MNATVVGGSEQPGRPVPTRRQPASRSHWVDAWRRIWRDRIATAFALILLVLVIVAALAPVISAFVTGFSPEAQDLGSVFSGPGGRHALGTDELGRDMLTRLVWGARVSLGVGFLAVLLMMVIGGGVGLLAGYYGGPLDQLLMRLVDVVLAIPPIFLLILVTSLVPLPVGPDPRHPWFVIRHDAVSLSVLIAVTSWGSVARLMRGEVMSIASRDFMLAARALGANDTGLFLRHLLPNAIPVMIIAASLGVGQIVLLEASLDFIGLGVLPPTPSWGNMLLSAQAYFVRSAWLVWLPGVCIALAVLAANVVGNAMRDAFDPRLH